MIRKSDFRNYFLDKIKSTYEWKFIRALLLFESHLRASFPLLRDSWEFLMPLLATYNSLSAFQLFAYCFGFLWISRKPGAAQLRPLFPGVLNDVLGSIYQSSWMITSYDQCTIILCNGSPQRSDFFATTILFFPPPREYSDFTLSFESRLLI